MTAQPGLGITGNGVGVTTPIAHRLAQSGLVAKAGGTRNLIRPGLFYDGTVNIVTGTAGMSYDVVAFTAALTRGAGQGAVLLANDGTVNVPTTAAPGSNSRIDIVYVWQRDFAIDGTDSNPVIGVVQGTAAATPAAPSLAAFPGALELARITVPAGVTATNSGATITQTAPFTAAAGGTLTVRTVGTLPTAATVGQRAFVIDNGITYQWDGATWQPPAVTPVGLVPIVPTSVAGTGVSVNAAGLVSFTGSTTVSVNGCFTSAYSFYDIIWDVPTTSVALDLSARLRSGGVDNSAAVYDYEIGTFSLTTTAAASATASTSFAIGAGARELYSGKMELKYPFEIRSTVLESKVNASNASGASSVISIRAGRHRTAAGFDGFSLIASTGNMTGQLKVYGYN